MKKLLITSLLASSVLLADTTMCFKENHKSMSTIENTKLDGGDCKSTYSLNEMKKDGWKVDDIKITPNKNDTYSFIYILKKNISSFNSSTNYMSKEELKKSFQEISKSEKEEKAKNLQNNQIASGKKIYIKKCQSCHGSKGEEEAFGTSKPLNTLTAKDMALAITGYQLDSVDNGNADVMKPIANAIVENDLINIEQYLKSIK